jgi:hypothetical protein
LWQLGIDRRRVRVRRAGQRRIGCRVVPAGGAYLRRQSLGAALAAVVASRRRA